MARPPTRLRSVALRDQPPIPAVHPPIPVSTRRRRLPGAGSGRERSSPQPASSTPPTIPASGSSRRAPPAPSETRASSRARGRCPQGRGRRPADAPAENRPGHGRGRWLRFGLPPRLDRRGDPLRLVLGPAARPRLLLEAPPLGRPLVEGETEGELPGLQLDVGAAVELGTPRAGDGHLDPLAAEVLRLRLGRLDRRARPVLDAAAQPFQPRQRPMQGRLAGRLVAAMPGPLGAGVDQRLVGDPGTVGLVEQGGAEAGLVAEAVQLVGDLEPEPLAVALLLAGREGRPTAKRSRRSPCGRGSGPPAARRPAAGRPLPPRRRAALSSSAPPRRPASVRSASHTRPRSSPARSVPASHPRPAAPGPAARPPPAAGPPSHRPRASSASPIGPIRRPGSAPGAPSPARRRRRAPPRPRRPATIPSSTSRAVFSAPSRPLRPARRRRRRGRA